jgi:hypothetical protein
MAALRESTVRKANPGVAHIDYLLAVLEDAYQDFSWTVWHEGVRAFDDGDPGSMRELEAIRRDAIKKQAHDPEALELIRTASHKQLLQYVHLTRARVYSEFQLAACFAWVAEQEGWREKLRQMLDLRDFAGIRKNYQWRQQQNPNARSLLAAISNAVIEVLVKGL